MSMTTGPIEETTKSTDRIGWIVATKTALVESFREVLPNDLRNAGGIAPIRIDVEYPVESEDWPALLIQFRPNSVQWIGLGNIPEIFIINEEPKEVRRAQFESAVDLTIMSLTSQERDRIWDSLIDMFLMGRTHPTLVKFTDKLHEHDFIDINVNDGVVDLLGDNIGVGTPWGTDDVTYEASLRFQIIGQFFSDLQTGDYIPLENIEVDFTIEGEPYEGFGGDPDGWQP